MATIFTRIVRGEIPSYKVAEDERFFAFLDINPLTKGHTLVVPKQETDYLFDLDDRTLADMIVFAKRIARKLKEKIECKKDGLSKNSNSLMQKYLSSRSMPFPNIL